MAGVKGMKHGVTNGKKASELLVDARYVSKTEESSPEKPDTPQQKMLREEKVRAPGKFLDRLESLERSHRSGNGRANLSQNASKGGEDEEGPQEAVAPVPDDGNRRGVEVYEKWLGEHRCD